MAQLTHKIFTVVDQYPGDVEHPYFTKRKVRSNGFSLYPRMVRALCPRRMARKQHRMTMASASAHQEPSNFTQSINVHNLLGYVGIEPTNSRDMDQSPINHQSCESFVSHSHLDLRHQSPATGLVIAGGPVGLGWLRTLLETLGSSQGGSLCPRGQPWSAGFTRNHREMTATIRFGAPIL